MSYLNKTKHNFSTLNFHKQHTHMHLSGDQKRLTLFYLEPLACILFSFFKILNRDLMFGKKLGKKDNKRNTVESKDKRIKKRKTDSNTCKYKEIKGCREKTRASQLP
ncbi:hypothetical protein PGB90_009061 [Kerria lacca]